MGKAHWQEYSYRQAVTQAARLQDRIGKLHLEFHYEMPEGTNITQPKVEKRAAPIESRVLEGPITRDFDEVYGFHRAGEMRTWIEQDIVTDNLQSSDENAPTHLRKQQGRPSLLR